ncbi:hypothetical protein AAFF_G00412920 [Aldrovandia affinis]|uniref:Uncharacterized protein n=1 Tax=Aldrovandia affinis TaxID=143900 RepID=A0AAD7WKE0_9TELE|nr:hypothetical protein AAFF_G00412920 [Aldrovandia affinis]
MTLPSKGRFETAWLSALNSAPAPSCGRSGTCSLPVERNEAVADSACVVLSTLSQIDDAAMRRAWTFQIGRQRKKIQVKIIFRKKERACL